MWKILQAGEWSSPAFLAHLDLHRQARALHGLALLVAACCTGRLEADVVVQAHMDDSDREFDT